VVRGFPAILRGKWVGGREQSQGVRFRSCRRRLPEALTGYTPLLPAVASTSGNTGPWDKPGSSRVVYLKNGVTAQTEKEDKATQFISYCAYSGLR
jgi:hypothetical protein